MRRASFFGLGTASTTQGLGALGTQDIIPERRARGYSDQTPELVNSLSAGLGLESVPPRNQINPSFKLNLQAQLGANDGSQ